MPGHGLFAKYPLEWLKFIRGPAAYVEQARAAGKDAYEPWAAFVFGLGINVAFAAYEAARWQGVLDKSAEQLFLFMIAVVNLAVVHGVCKGMDGAASTADMTAAFEYLYGFLTPLMAGCITLAMAITELFPGIKCYVALDVFRCDGFRTTTNIILVAAVQTFFVFMGVYVLVVFNSVIARLQGLGRGKVLFAQFLALVVLFFLGNLIYALAHWIATRFKHFAAVIGGG